MKIGLVESSDPKFSGLFTVESGAPYSTVKLLIRRELILHLPPLSFFIYFFTPKTAITRRTVYSVQYSTVVDYTLRVLLVRQADFN